MLIPSAQPGLIMIVKQILGRAMYRCGMVEYQSVILDSRQDVFCEEDGTREFGKQPACPACKFTYSTFVQNLHYLV